MISKFFTTWNHIIKPVIITDGQSMYFIKAFSNNFVSFLDSY